MDTFLVKTLKDVPLNKKATDQKDRLVGKVRLMMDDMSVTPGDNRKSSLLPDDQEEYDDINAPGVAKVPASSLRNKLQSGLLDKKKKSGLKSWEPYYCVVSGNMFYMYKKASDAKQKEAFCLTGYDFQEAPSLDSNRGDMCFELTKPGSIPAACKDGMLEWRQSILKGVKFVEAYENAHLDGNKSAASQAHKPEDDQEIYDEVGAREAAYYTECASDRPTSDNFYMNQGLYENSNGKTTYDLMGQAPPPPKEVEVFLVETLKSVKLGKNVSEQKERLVEKVKRILEEIPGSASTFNLNDSRNDSNGSLKISGGDGSSSGNSNSGTQAAEEEHGYGEDITKVPCSSLQNKLQSGLLDKKKKSGFKTWESLYCVVSGNIFYLYKKQTDSKQKEAFCLTGYEFHENPSLDSGRKEMCFELTKPGSATYQFRASSKDGMIEWRDSIAKGIQLTSGGPGDEEEPGEDWWVGELGGKIGLVPKQYLCPAFELVR
nr:hypothetical protein BaRGS_026493 [Batillaria attramentaria]